MMEPAKNYLKENRQCALQLPQASVDTQELPKHPVSGNNNMLGHAINKILLLASVYCYIAYDAKREKF